MDESATRRKLIDPKLYAQGWEQEQYPESEILTEQRAYITPGQVSALEQNRRPKKADYVLEYRGCKLAIIEAKSDEKDVSEGVAQAKLYAEMMCIRFTYSCNGSEIWAIDMGVKDSAGEYIVPSTEGPVDRFPTPDELWRMTFPEHNEWRDRFNLCAYNRAGGRSPRYYQENAIDAVLNAIARGQDRILLTMATGTGKTYTAFQICWKLTQTRWTASGVNREPRILFIADRNILANQAVNDFEQFPEDAMVRITPELLHDKKHRDRVPTARQLYFTIFQTFMCDDGSGEPYYKQYPSEFFDLIIIDECHRGGANDESEWRQVMEYFEPAYQLGMTATPRRRDNANTYRYFGNPVYSYSLKQGIADGFLTPFRVKTSESNIDEYKYDPDDDVEGEIDPDRVYTEHDFYCGNIQIKQRDEYRVKELLGKMGQDEKTIIFCATQEHAMIIRDMVNQHKTCPDPNYCQRVTADDGAEGEKTLKLFRNNDLLRPTVLTTSQKLSTGVDARNVRNIVLMRPVNNIVEFKQILGRGTRLFEGKYYFTLYDFVGAAKNFQDAEWDGDPFCPVCGNFPCTCLKNKKPDGGGGGGGEFWPPQPCPVCGHLPCTCPGGKKKSRLKVRLSTTRELLLETRWTENIMFGDELITLEEFIQRLFGILPKIFKGEDDLREKWAAPKTRQELLSVLERSGFAEDKLEMMRSFMNMDNADMLDVLEYLAYETTPIDRERRAEIVREDALKNCPPQQQKFMNFILGYYVKNGFKELEIDKLPTFMNLKYHSVTDGLTQLKMSPQEVMTFYLHVQHELYAGSNVCFYKAMRQQHPSSTYPLWDSPSQSQGMAAESPDI